MTYPPVEAKITLMAWTHLTAAISWRVEVLVHQGTETLHKEKFDNASLPVVLGWVRGWCIQEDMPYRASLMPVKMQYGRYNPEPEYDFTREVPISDLFNDDDIVMARLQIT